MKNTVEEDILDVELFERPLEVHSKGEDNSDGCCFDKRAESSTIVKSAGNLSISLSDQMCFEVGSMLPSSLNLV